MAEAHKIAVRTRLFAVAVTALLFLATVVAVWAVEQRALARRNESSALIRLADAQSDRRPVEATKIALSLLGDRDKRAGKFGMSTILEKVRAGVENFAGDTRPPMDDSPIYDVLGHAVPNLRQMRVFENAGRYAEYSPDGKVVIVVSDRSRPKVLDARSWALLNSPLDFRTGYATLSDDGKLVLTRSKVAALWDATTGRPLVKLEDDAQQLDLTSAALSRDGKRAVTASVSSAAGFQPTARKPTLQVWDVVDSVGTVRAAPGLVLGGRSGEGHTGKVNLAAFSRDGTRIVTASDDQTVRVWNAASGECELTIHLPDRGLYAAFSPDGTRVVAVSDDDAAQVWEIDHGRPIGRQMNHSRKINSAVFSPDGKQIVTASDDGTARLWDASSDTSLGAPILTLEGHEARVNFAGFSPDGTRVVTSSDDNTVRIWDSARGRAHLTLAGHDGVVWTAALNADGTRAVTASNDGFARIWDTKQGVLVGEPMQHSREVTSAAFNVIGDLIVTASPVDGTQVWDAATGAWKHGFHDATVTYAAFSPDGGHIATAYEDGRVRIWNAAAGESMPEPIELGHKGKVWSVEFSPDGRRIVSASDDGTARVWDLAKKEVSNILRHREGIYFASFSPDGQAVVTASEDNLGYVWDVSTSVVRYTLAGHRGWVNSAAFSEDGARVVTGSKDGTARVWDAATGRTIAVLSGHNGGVEIRRVQRGRKGGSHRL